MSAPPPTPYRSTVLPIHPIRPICPIPIGKVHLTGTRCDLVDTDNDGHSDLEEALTTSWSGVNQGGPSYDTDGDGIPDVVEAIYAPFMNPYNGEDGPGDLDSDGVSNFHEYLSGTHLSGNTNHLDYDGDGISDIVEDAWSLIHPGLLNKYRFEDAAIDSDGDGVLNCEEVLLSMPLLERPADPGNPHSWPTTQAAGALDMDDGQMFLWLRERGDVPAYTSLADINHNQLPDGYEAWIVSLPAVPVSKPASVDVDDDGIDNQWEHRYGLPLRSSAGSGLMETYVREYPLVPPPPPVAESYADPADFTIATSTHQAALAEWQSLHLTDPDHDGLCNYSEYMLGTHPKIADSDHDGIPDGVEAALSSSPTNGSSVPQGSSWITTHPTNVAPNVAFTPHNPSNQGEGTSSDFADPDNYRLEFEVEIRTGTASANAPFWEGSIEQNNIKYYAGISSHFYHEGMINHAESTTFTSSPMPGSGTTTTQQKYEEKRNFIESSYTSYGVPIPVFSPLLGGRTLPTTRARDYVAGTLHTTSSTESQSSAAYVLPHRTYSEETYDGKIGRQNGQWVTKGTKRVIKEDDAEPNNTALNYRTTTERTVNGYPGFKFDLWYKVAGVKFERPEITSTDNWSVSTYYNYHPLPKLGDPFPAEESKHAGVDKQSIKLWGEITPAMLRGAAFGYASRSTWVPASTPVTQIFSNRETATAEESRYRIVARYVGPGQVPADFQDAPVLHALVKREVTGTTEFNGATQVINTVLTPITLTGGQATELRTLPLVEDTEPPVSGLNNRGATLSLRPFSIELVAHPVLSDGSISPAEGLIQPSMPSPIVDVANCTLENIRVGPNGEMLGDLAVGGTITSAVCDTLPGARGTINEAALYVNGVPEAFTSLAVGISKGDDGPPGRRYPYLGSFNQVIQAVPLVAGNNVFRFSAQDKVFDMPGFHTWTAEVRVIENDGEGSVNPLPAELSASIALPSATLNPLLPDQISLAYSDGTSSVSGIQLTETGADSGVFAGSLNQQPVEFVVEEINSISVAKRDVLRSTLLIGGSGGTTTQVTFRESETASGVFVGGHSSYALAVEAPGSPETDTVQVGYPTPGEQSNGGESYSYGLELKFPTNLFDSLPQISVTWEGVKFDAKWDASTNQVLMHPESGDKPSIFTLRLSEVGLAMQLNDDNIVEDLESSNATFSTALLAGLGVGGGDLITGTSSIILAPANNIGKGVLMGSLGLIWAGQSLTGTDNQNMERVIAKIGKSHAQELMQSADMVKALAQLALLSAQSEAELKETILKMLLTSTQGGDVEAVAAESETLVMALTFCAETLPQMWKDMANASDAKKGYYSGRILFEVVSFLYPAAKASTLAKVTKAEFLTKFMQKPIFSKLPAATTTVIRTLATDLATTKMCFIAGTKVLSKKGFTCIESIRQGDLVWSRDEFSQQEGWMPVVETFVTHPREIYRLTYTVRGPPEGGGSVDSHTETLGVTAPHPFWVVNRKKPGFVPAEDLKIGDELALAGGVTAEVKSKTLEHKSEGQTFTTYNFEVDQFHTYFVGNAGVWVHNTGLPCDEVFSVFFQKAKAYASGTDLLRAKRFATLMDTKLALRMRPTITDSNWRRSAVEVSEKILKDFSEGNLQSLDDVPTFRKWDTEFFGGISRGRGESDAAEVHHAVERWIQSKLGLSPADDVPGAVMFKKTGLPEGHAALQGRLRSAIYDLTDSDAIIDAMRQVYLSRPEWQNIWPVAARWLEQRGFNIP